MDLSTYTLTTSKHVYSKDSSLCVCVCVCACMCVEAAKNLPGAPSINSRRGYSPPAQPLLAVHKGAVRYSPCNGLNHTKGSC